MLTEKIRVKKLREGALLPTYGSDFAAGADLYACLEESAVLEPGETRLIATGIAMEIPAGFAGLIYARSGLSVKKGLAPANKVGVVDADYRGEIMVPLHNHSGQPATVETGERIAQMIVTPYLTGLFEESQDLTETVRGKGGFGSTGRH